MFNLMYLIMFQFSLDFSVNISSKIEFTSANRELHAKCFHKTKTIKVNRDHWKTLPLHHKKELLYHELGHCELNLRHVRTADIMHPRAYSTKADSSNWDALISRMKASVKND